MTVLLLLAIVATLLCAVSSVSVDHEPKIVVPTRIDEPPKPVLQTFDAGNLTTLQWGEWGRVMYCNPGHRAYGFALKLEKDQGMGDDTALNGIALACTDGVAITSTIGDWGTWTKYQYCPNNAYITSFQIRVQPPQGDMIDDTGANDMNMFCSNGQYLYGNGMKWGNWNQWSQVCPRGICGISTLVLPNQGFGDDVGLNDVAMYCC